MTRSLPEVANQFANLIGNKPSGDLLVGLGHFPVSGSDAGVQEILPLGPLMGRDEQFIQYAEFFLYIFKKFWDE